MASTAQSIQFLLSQVSHGGGTTLTNGKAYFYDAGTSTPKTIWLDRDKATPAANPYTLDANGTAQLYGDGIYRIVIKDAAGVIRYDRDGLSFLDNGGEVTDLTADVTSLMAKSIKNVSEYASLADAVATIGSTRATLAFKKDQVVSTNLTIPATLELFPLDGAVINHGSNTITYAGNTAKWGAAQVFDGAGAVTLTGAAEVYPDWFGFSETENATFINRALTAAGGRCPVVLLGKDYNTIASVTMSANDTLEGVSPDLSHLRNSGAGGNYAITTNAATADSYGYINNLNIRNMKITGGTGGTGGNALTSDRTVNLSNVALSNISNVVIQNGKTQLYVEHGMYNRFEKVKMYANGGTQGAYITHGEAVALPGLGITTTQVFDHCYASGGTYGFVVAPSTGASKSTNLTVFRSPVVEATQSSAFVFGRGAAFYITGLHSESINLSNGANPIFDLWSTGSDATADTNNVGTIVGSFIQGGGAGYAFTVDRAQNLYIEGNRVGGVATTFNIPTPANFQRGTITLGSNFMVPSAGFINDAATYTAMVNTVPRMIGQIPIAYNSTSRDRVNNSDRVSGTLYASSAAAGSVVLVGGAATVPTTAITSDSIVLLTVQSSGGTNGHLRVTTRNTGVSFTISSTSASETSTVGWMIVKPI